jgi:hypothetical protein
MDILKKYKGEKFNLEQIESIPLKIIYLQLKEETLPKSKKVYRGRFVV